MSREITEENAQGVFVPLSNQTENLNQVRSSFEDMKISSHDNPTDEKMLHPRSIIKSDNSSKDGLDHLNSKVDIPIKNENSTQGNNDGCLAESLIEKVRYLDISQDKAVNVKSTIDQGTSTQGQMSESLRNFKKYSELSDSSDNEDYGSIELKGLSLGDKEFDDDEYVESEESNSESDYDSEEGQELQTKEDLENINIKRRKVQEEGTWLSTLGDNKLSELPRLSDLELNNKEEFTHMGNLECVIDKIVTIAGLSGMPAYDLDTLLFLEEGQKVLGFVMDVMGPVNAPVYIIPVNSAETLKDLQLQKGTKVYCAPNSKYTKYVFLQELMKIRGSGASWTGETDMASESQVLSDDEQEHASKDTTKEAKRKCSQERHKKFVRDMNRANERDTRLHRMADVHRLHLERVAGAQTVNRQQTRDSRTRNQCTGSNFQNSEGRRSRPIFRNHLQGSMLAELQRWSMLDTPAPSTRSLNTVPVMHPFDPSIPPPNYTSPRFYLPSEENMFSSFVGFVHPQNFNSRNVDFERSINRPNVRQNNMPGPSNEECLN